MALESYRRVVPSFWNDPDVRVLSQPAKLALLYYVTSPHGNMIGLYHCPTMYAAREIGMPATELHTLLCTELTPFVSYDANTEEVLVHAMAKHQIESKPKATDKRLTSVRRLVAAAHSPELVSLFLTKYADWDLKIEAPSKPLRSPFEAPSCAGEGASYRTGTDAGTGTPAGGGRKTDLSPDWTVPFLGCWEVCIGVPNAAAIRDTLSPLIDAHGVHQVWGAWDGYCRRFRGKPAEVRYASPRKFAEGYQGYAAEWARYADEAGTDCAIPSTPGLLRFPDGHEPRLPVKLKAVPA